MEYRDDLFQALMSGLSTAERSELLATISDNTDRLLEQKRNSIGSRGGRRQRTTVDSADRST